MTATVLEFRPRTAGRGPAPLLWTRLPKSHPPIVDSADWWHCPAWCSDCVGGGKFDNGDDEPQDTPRRHAHRLFSVDMIDSSGNRVKATVEVVAVEDPDLGWTHPPTVEIEATAALDPDSADRFAAAVLHASTFARKPLPLITRPSSQGGGRGSTPLESA